MRGRSGPVWWGMCMMEVMHGREVACMVGGMHGRGDVRGRGHACQGGGTTAADGRHPIGMHNCKLTVFE